MLGVISAAAFTLAALVFALSFAGIDAVRLVPGLAWSLHLTAMALGLALVISAKRHSKRHPEDGAGLGVLFLDTPRWAVMTFFMLVLAAFVSLGDMIIVGEGGEAAIVDGHCVLQSKGRVLRRISVDEYDAQILRESRTVAAVWMIGLFLSVSWFLLRWPYKPQAVSQS